MFGTKSYELIKDLERTKNGALPPFEENSVRQVFNEMEALHELNHKDLTLRMNASILEREENDNTQIMRLRHLGIQRNKQCVLAYLYNRLIRIRDERWIHGSVLPETVRLNTTESEQQFFRNYNKILANYMKNVGNGSGIDITQNMKPPRSIKSQVRVLQDWEIEDEDTGDPVILKKDSIHFLEGEQCETLVRQGVLEILKIS